MKREQLWSVGLLNKRTHANLRLLVWADCNPDAAARKLKGALIGEDCEYALRNVKPEYNDTGTGHVYREVPGDE